MSASLIGASILSAAGSLPLHLLPLLVVAFVREGRLPVAQAGWAGSAYLIGLLTVAILLPTLRFTSISRKFASASAGVLLIALVCSTISNVSVLLIAWFCIGAACGVFQFLGNAAAAQHRDKQAAFSIRLAITLLLAGTVVGLLQAMDSLASYEVLSVRLMLMLLPVTAIGLVLYRPSQGLLPVSGNVVAGTRKGWQWLVIVYVLFVGQPGFWAYAVQLATERGVLVRDAAIAIAASKICSAVLLYYLARTKRVSSHIGFSTSGALVGLGVLLMAISHSAAVFTIGLVVWELGLNVLSARLQGKAAEANPLRAAQWLTAAIFLGAATGPILHGAAIEAGLGVLFIALSISSALLPALMLGIQRKNRPTGQLA